MRIIVSINILKIIHNSMTSSVEKEQADNAQKVKDSQEAASRIIELQRKVEHAREVVCFAIHVLLFYIKLRVIIKSSNHNKTNKLDL